MTAPITLFLASYPPSSMERGQGGEVTQSDDKLYRIPYNNFEASMPGYVSMRMRFVFRIISALVLATLILGLASCGVIGEFRQSLVESTRAAAASGASARASGRPGATVPPTATSTPAPTSALAIDPAQLKGVTISFWHPWTGAAGKVIADLVDEFNRSNTWGISVVPTAQGSYDQLDEAVATRLKTGELPDITVAYLYQALAWNASGAALVDLSAYVDDPVWGLDGPAQADFYPVFWEHDLQDGKRLGLPAQGSAQVLYYNATWARELGFNSPPSTSEEFKRQACAASQAALRDQDSKNDHKGGWIISTNYTAVLGWIYAFGSTIEAPDGGGYRFDTPEVGQAFDYLRDLLDGGCAWLSESQYPEAEFASRLGLFATGSAAGVPFQESAFVDAGSQDEWSVLPFPSPTGDAVMPVYGPSFQVMSATTEKQLASWLLIKWLTEPAQQAALTQVSSYFPVRASSLELMGVLPAAHPQWKTALELLPLARHEPALASWRIVRWAVSDAATQLYRYYFEIDKVPTLIKLLEQTANDLNTKK